MAKNVVIISASPRKKGNSDLLCDRFLEGAEDAGHRAEKIFLGDKTINYCLGCMACQKNGGTCPQKDDAAEVLEKMVAADVLVMATPVYFYTMNAQMKTLIDRTCAIYPDIGTKDIYFIATATDTNRDTLERTIDGFRGFTSCFDGLHEKGIIYGVGVTDAGDIRGSQSMDEAYAMGKNV
jgi:multimeric flavodoxin WrbA